jgi:hypothetical protein
MNILPTVATKRPTLSLNFSGRGDRIATISQRCSPTLADDELRRIVAAMIG